MIPLFQEYLSNLTECYSVSHCRHFGLSHFAGHAEYSSPISVSGCFLWHVDSMDSLEDLLLHSPYFVFHSDHQSTLQLMQKG